MLRKLFTGLFLLHCAISIAQTPSGIGYPLAQCSGGTCPPVTAVRTHVTTGYIDTLTETFYAAGPFRTLGGQARIGIGAMNAATGALLPFAPVIDTFGCVYAIAKKGDTLFVGGRFSSVNGAPRTNFAAIRISNGQLLPSFSTGVGGVNDTVFAITVYNNRIYIAGKFNTVFAQSRTNMARVNYNGTVDTWAPAAMGVVQKTMQWRNRLLAIARAPASESRLVRIDTAFTATVTQVMITTNSSSYGFDQSIQDFVTRNDSVYAVGNFYEVDGVLCDGFVAANLNTNVKRSWSVVIPNAAGDAYNKVYVEYYRDSLYIGTFNAANNIPANHRLYAAHYRGSTLRVMKTYNSNATGLNGWFCNDFYIGNARLMEIEKFAQHTAFPDGSVNCDFYSWCLKIPTLCGNWIGTPYSACPSDTIVVSVAHQYYYASYVWNVNFGNVTLVPNGNTCMVITAGNFTGAQITVRGATSCGIQNSTPRTIVISALTPPNVSAGPDDTLTCLITSTVLYGTCTPAPFSWLWTGPNTTGNADSVFANEPGTYYLQCTGTNGCRKTDSAVVYADTVPPVIVPFGSAPVITCAQSSVVLDASSVYPNDSLRWIIGASSFANPANVSAPGNVLLIVTDLQNGCSSTDTVLITQNITPPSGYAVYTDTLLTCSRDSVLLSGASANPDAVFEWHDSSSNTFPDPLYATAPGFYALFVTDTSNGCSAQSDQVLINTWYTPPSVNAGIDSLFINCSYDSVLLNASSLTLSATIQWTDSIAFSANNPVMAGQQGWYYAVATDSLNGCVAIDSTYIGYEPALDVIASADTSICAGSGAVLNGVPVGGSAPFSYVWNNAAGNTALVTVYPGDTLMYIVSVNDGEGCTGTDTVMVNVPDTLADSTLAFQPCDPLQPTGQIQLYASGGVPPYLFSIDNGLTWQTGGVFSGLTYGSYSFLIQDALGCTRSTSALIDTNSLSPAPEFLVATSPELADTIVIVDISNPRPDSVAWDFPSGTTIVDTSMFSPSIVAPDTGAFVITMHAFYGSCEVILVRTIQVNPYDSLNASPWNSNAIDSLALYPNPNNGTFTMYTHLGAEQNFVILVTDELGNERARVQVSDADEWSGMVNVSNPVPGSYVLRVIAEYDAAAVPFIISQ